MTNYIEGTTDHAATTIKIFATTRDRIVAVGRKGETYDKVINRLLDFNDALTVGVSNAMSPEIKPAMESLIPVSRPLAGV